MCTMNGTILSIIAKRENMMNPYGSVSCIYLPKKKQYICFFIWNSMEKTENRPYVVLLTLCINIITSVHQAVSVMLFHKRMLNMHFYNYFCLIHIIILCKTKSVNAKTQYTIQKQKLNFCRLHTPQNKQLKCTKKVNSVNVDKYHFEYWVKNVGYFVGAISSLLCLTYVASHAKFFLLTDLVIVYSQLIVKAKG